MDIYLWEFVVRSSFLVIICSLLVFGLRADVSVTNTTYQWIPLQRSDFLNASFKATFNPGGSIVIGLKGLANGLIELIIGKDTVTVNVVSQSRALVPPIVLNNRIPLVEAVAGTYNLKIAPSSVRAGSYAINFTVNDSVVFDLDSVLFPEKIVAYSWRKTLKDWVLVGPGNPFVLLPIPTLSIKRGDLVQFKAERNFSLMLDKSKKIILASVERFSPAGWFKVWDYNPSSSLLRLSTIDNELIVLRNGLLVAGLGGADSLSLSYNFINNKICFFVGTNNLSASGNNGLGFYQSVQNLPLLPLELSIVSQAQKVMYELRVESLSLSAVQDAFQNKIILAFREPRKTLPEWMYLLNSLSSYLQSLQQMFNFTNAAQVSNDIINQVISYLAQIAEINDIPNNIKDSLNQISAAWTNLRPVSSLINSGDTVQIKFSDGSLLSFNESSRQIVAKRTSVFDEGTHFKIENYNKNTLRFKLRSVVNNSPVLLAGTSLALGSAGVAPFEFNLIYNPTSKKYKLKSSVTNFLSVSSGRVQLSAIALDANTLLDITVLSSDICSLDGITISSLDVDQVTTDINSKFAKLFGLSTNSEDDFRYLTESFIKYTEMVRNKLDFVNSGAKSNQIVNLLTAAIGQIISVPTVSAAAKARLSSVGSTLISFKPAAAEINDEDVVQIKLSLGSFLTLKTGATTLLSKTTSGYDAETFLSVKKYDKDAGRIFLKTLDAKPIGISEMKLSALSQTLPSLEFLLSVDRARNIMTLSLVGTPRLYMQINPSKEIIFSTSGVNSQQSLLLQKVPTAKQALLGLKTTGLTLGDVSDALSKRFIPAFDVEGNTADESAYLADVLVSFIQLAVTDSSIKAGFTRKLTGQNMSCYDQVFALIEKFKTKTTFPAASITKISSALTTAFSRDQVVFDSLTPVAAMTAALVAADVKDKIAPLFASLSSSKTLSDSFVNGLGLYLGSVKEKLGDLNLIQLPGVGAGNLTVSTYSSGLLKFLMNLNASASVSVITAAKKLLETLFPTVRLSSMSDFYKFDLAVNSKVVLRFDANNKSSIVKIISGKLVGEANLSNTVKESHFEVASYNKDTFTLAFKNAPLDKPMVAEVVFLNNKFSIALKNDKNEYLSSASPADPSAQLDFSASNSKVLFNIVPLSEVDYLFDSLILPSKAEDVISSLVFFAQAFGFLKTKPSSQLVVYGVFESFVNTLIASPLAKTVITNGLTTIDLIRQLIYLFASQPYLTDETKGKILILLSKNEFSLGAATLSTTAGGGSQADKSTTQNANYLLPDGSMKDIPADILLYAKALSDAAKDTDGLKKILDSCATYITSVSSRIDWVAIATTSQKSAYRDLFKNMLKKLQQKDLASYYSGLNDSLKKQITDLLVSADDDKPTYDLQVGLMNDLGKKITTVAQLTTTSDLQKLLLRLSGKVALNGSDQLRQTLFDKVCSYYSKEAVPAIGTVGSSATDKKALADWNLSLMDRFIVLLTTVTVTADNIDSKMPLLKNVCDQISKCALAERPALIKKLSDGVLAKFAPIVKASAASATVRNSTFKSILQQLDGLVVNSVNNIWRTAGISRLEE